MNTFRFTKQDWLAALFVTLFVLFIGAATLTKGVPDWGDDFAAYMSEGMAIADGEFHEQTVRNYTMHPSPLTLEASEDGLVYVWGYPLMLSGIYKLVGFDRVNYSSILWYKIPLLISVGLLGGVLVLFFRRRFFLGLSAVLALLVCLSGDLFGAMNNLYSDLPFLFFSMLTFLIVEEVAENVQEGKKGIWLGILYGAVLWFTHELRLNGMTVCAVAFFGHALILLKNRKGIKKKGIWMHVIPYVVFIALTFITEHLWLAPATSNMSDVGRATPEMLSENIAEYWKMIYGYLDGLFGVKLHFAGYVLVAAVVLGILFKGITENLHLTLLVIGTLIVDVMLPYRQGLRYIYNILPLLVMFAAYGLQFIVKFIIKVMKVPGKYLEYAGVVLSVLVLAMPVYSHMKDGIFNLNHWGWMNYDDVYIGEAVEVYNYIQENVPEDNIIAFAKPRALYLNTGRVAIRTGYNGHRISDADYYLQYHISHSEFSPEKEEAARTPMEEMFSNEFFTLYKIVTGEEEIVSPDMDGAGYEN